MGCGQSEAKSHYKKQSQDSYRNINELSKRTQEQQREKHQDIIEKADSNELIKPQLIETNKSSYSIHTESSKSGDDLPYRKFSTQRDFHETVTQELTTNSKQVPAWNMKSYTNVGNDAKSPLFKRHSVAFISQQSMKANLENPIRKQFLQLQEEVPITMPILKQKSVEFINLPSPVKNNANEEEKLIAQFATTTRCSQHFAVLNQQLNQKIKIKKVIPSLDDEIDKTQELIQTKGI